MDEFPDLPKSNFRGVPAPSLPPHLITPRSSTLERKPLPSVKIASSSSPLPPSRELPKMGGTIPQPPVSSFEMTRGIMESIGAQHKSEVDRIGEIKSSASNKRFQFDNVVRNRGMGSED